MRGFPPTTASRVKPDSRAPMCSPQRRTITTAIIILIAHHYQALPDGPPVLSTLQPSPACLRGGGHCDYTPTGEEAEAQRVNRPVPAAELSGARNASQATTGGGALGFQPGAGWGPQAGCWDSSAAPSAVPSQPAAGGGSGVQKGGRLGAECGLHPRVPETVAGRGRGGKHTMPRAPRWGGLPGVPW